ncbi:hypothetical protein [Spirochaeta africana]|uniref:Outer membrane protein beta-barrel domain-containing protein n=1 Tax=Spirochaeta africana (strain ATCC 700263 / DSM 8902 / Z-7692) TaxID=889378 RepID=H9UGR3_SPIAZ|nr:hypothetical protein [Spirochaeta africana]AFG36706.1 hypothetical protein Spiaf_0606 [Spirochaeta africana DSM 8902]
MKRYVAALILTGLLFAPSAAAQSFGSGFSVFLPESMLHREGSPAVETGLSTSIGVTPYLSIPVGFTYIKVNGLLPDTDDADSPWIYSDNLIGTVGLRASLDIGPVALAAGGGGVLNWMPVYQVLEHTLAQHFAESTDEIVALVPGSLETELGLGLGWYLESGIEFKVTPQIGISLSGRYYQASSPFSAEAEAYTIDTTNPGNTAAAEPVSTDTRIRLRGISVGIGGSFRF